MTNRECPKCGVDATPITIHGQEIRACGLLREREWIFDMKIEGCPIKDTDKPAALPDASVKPELSHAEGKPERTTTCQTCQRQKPVFGQCPTCEVPAPAPHVYFVNPVDWKGSLQPCTSKDIPYVPQSAFGAVVRERDELLAHAEAWKRDNQLARELREQVARLEGKGWERNQELDEIKHAYDTSRSNADLRKQEIERLEKELAEANEELRRIEAVYRMNREFVEDAKLERKKIQAENIGLLQLVSGQDEQLTTAISELEREKRKTSQALNTMDARNPTLRLSIDIAREALKEEGT